jgi:hypothetical protein
MLRLLCSIICNAYQIEQVQGIAFEGLITVHTLMMVGQSRTQRATTTTCHSLLITLMLPSHQSAYLFIR